MTPAPARPDASFDAALNGVRVLDPRLADGLRVPVGGVVPWARAFPRPARAREARA